MNASILLLRLRSEIGLHTVLQFVVLRRYALNCDWSDVSKKTFFCVNVNFPLNNLKMSAL